MFGLRSAALALLAVVIAAAPGCSRKISDASVRTISTAEVASRVRPSGSGPTLIDVRAAAEFRDGHIPGAVNLRLSDVSADERDPLPASIAGRSSIIVYGRDPGDGLANAMAKRLLARGVKNVQLFEGGYSAWLASGGMPAR
ncbi:MAG: rhodanese-like domain-containing protein [Planctomycetota bacterium]|nr:rhodanese-like domain-containing protein [Planctomycetota bacterium]